jgi:peptide deformylase
VVNPVLAPPVTAAEGFLSVPGQHAMVTRPALAAVTVAGLDVHGEPVTITGTWPAACSTRPQLRTTT